MPDSPKLPKIEVRGLYSPIANRAAYDKYVAEYVDSCDPRYFDDGTRALFEKYGRSVEALTPDEREDLASQIERTLSDAVYVEALVSNADDRFDPGDFGQPDPNLPAGHGQVAWNETYLTEDGESVIAGYPRPEIPKLDRYRVVFVIHSWKARLPLESSYGPLACPEIQPLPDRLWRLVPYETVD
jgi:hypothetical protein